MSQDKDHENPPVVTRDRGPNDLPGFSTEQMDRIYAGNRALAEKWTGEATSPPVVTGDTLAEIITKAWQLSAAVDAGPDLEEHLCVHCDEPYSLNDGDEPTALCHDCAQEAAQVLPRLYDALRAAQRENAAMLDELAAVWSTCNVTYRPPAPAYPIEHNQLAGKGNRASILAAIGIEPAALAAHPQQETKR